MTARRGRSRSFPTIGIVGLGYVGLTTATAFAERGRTVVGFDLDPRRRAVVAAGRAPIHEPSLPPLLRRAVRSGRLTVAHDIPELLRRCELVFLCVPTPSRPDGAVDVRFVRAASAAVGEALRGVRGWRGIVVKSTVTPGTTERLVAATLASASGRTLGRTFGVASNPEFLAEGTAVRDALHPSRIVLGVSDRRTESALRGAYAGFPAPILVLSPTAAELVKYASNAMLATRVSFTNEVSRLAEKLGVDIYPVMAAVGLDPRIGPRFLAAGPGFGGSCFTKDLHALVAAAAAVRVRLPVTSATLAVNDDQARHVVELAAAAAGTVRGRTVAVLGLAFKPDTDDVRESRAFPIVAELLRRGARVRLHDPAAGPNFLAGMDPALRARHRRSIRPVGSLRAAVTGADLALIQCDWDEYRRAPVALWSRLRRRLIVDARRTLDAAALARRGIEYVAIGR
jgi:UDPglucose 6-dehydrogenase